jgi:hypothetical protein
MKGQEILFEGRKKRQIEGEILCFKLRNKESKMWHHRDFILIKLIMFFFLDRNSRCNSGWPQTCDHPATASCMAS